MADLGGRCATFTKYLLYWRSPVIQDKPQKTTIISNIAEALDISDMNLCLHKLISAHLTSHACFSAIPYFSYHPHPFSVPSPCCLTLNASAYACPVWGVPFPSQLTTKPSGTIQASPFLSPSSTHSPWPIHKELMCPPFHVLLTYAFQTENILRAGTLSYLPFNLHSTW